MGRELKRVALDFDWPENKTWKGYLNPHYDKNHKCEACNGRGTTYAHQRLYDVVSLLMLSGSDAERGEHHPYFDMTMLYGTENMVCGNDIIELAQGLAGREQPLSGYNDADKANAVAKIISAAGMPKDWGRSWQSTEGDDDVCVGTSIAYQRVFDLVTLLLQSGEDAIRGTIHPLFNGAPLPKTKSMVCGKEMHALTVGLAGRDVSLFGHDAIDKWSAKKKIIAAAGLEENWGICPSCNGDGSIWESAEAEKEAEEWKEYEPPAGNGYQIWETVSEGSPISPVFDTPEALARYMSGTRWGADKGTSYESWLKFIKGPGWAPSMVMDAKGVRTGPDAAL